VPSPLPIKALFAKSIDSFSEKPFKDLRESIENNAEKPINLLFPALINLP